MHDILQLLLSVGTIIGAAGAVTYWGGRIASSVEVIAEQLRALRTDLSEHGSKLQGHGERIAKIEARQEGQ